MLVFFLIIKDLIFRLSSYAARKTGVDEVGLEIRGELTKFEQQLLLRQEFVVVRGKVNTFIKFFLISIVDIILF